MLFLLYLVFIMFYAYNRPIGGREFHDDIQNDQFRVALEITLWTMNLSYILYEIQECIEKGFADYLNFGRKGQVNILDVVISLLWLFLGGVRIFFIMEKWTFDGSNAHWLEQIYLFSFGFQIILLTIRGLSLFSNSIYLGTLLRAVKLMALEIVKFFSIFVVVMFGFLFGLWLITAANECIDNNSDDCGDYAVNTIGEGLGYVFEVFIGTGDLSGVADEPIAIYFMVIATIFGTLILTNLLIALMTTEYEKVKDAAKGEVIHNHAELTYDLSQRSRSMPPPLNIVVLVIALIVDIINFFFALCKPSKWNIYAKIDHQLFFNLQSFNIWQCEHGADWKPSRGTKIKYETRKDVLEWYLYHWILKYYYWIKCDNFRKDWKEGSMVEIYSNSKQKWFEGEILKIFNDNSNIEWLKVKYDINGIKEVQRESNLIRAGNKTNDSKPIDWRIHHKSCYGCLVYPADALRKETYRGITMNVYLERYEIGKRQQIEKKDKKLLKQLATNTLFCEYCYRPFLKGKVKDELVTPYEALIDLISALLFIVIPVAWIPLVLIFTCLAAKDFLFATFKDNDHRNENYKHADFDKEVCFI